MSLNSSLEKHQLKISIGVLVSILIFLMTISSNVATWKNDVDNRIGSLSERQEHIVDKFNDVTDRVSDLETESVDVKVRLATIETKLDDIQITLIEIKKEIKNSNGG